MFMTVEIIHIHTTNHSYCVAENITFHWVLTILNVTADEACSYSDLGSSLAYQLVRASDLIK